jgi:hypothetical protein
VDDSLIDTEFERWLQEHRLSPTSVGEMLRHVFQSPRTGSEREPLPPDWAMQYYVAGRLAARAGLVPVYGNLLHHAVEMFLKTALSGVVSPKELRDDYRHDLKKLWARFKVEVADTSLDHFDATILALHEFEELRYPDKIPHAAIEMDVTWKPVPAAKSSSGSGSARRYECVIADIDGLIIEIMDRIPLNPSFFVVKLGDSGREALQYQNPHSSRWS